MGVLSWNHPVVAGEVQLLATCLVSEAGAHDEAVVPHLGRCSRILSECSVVRDVAHLRTYSLDLVSVTDTIDIPMGDFEDTLMCSNQHVTYVSHTSWLTSLVPRLSTSHTVVSHDIWVSIHDPHESKCLWGWGKSMMSLSHYFQHPSLVTHDVVRSGKLVQCLNLK